MKKKNILLIFLAVPCLVGFMILGNSLTKKLEQETPPVVLPTEKPTEEHIEKEDPFEIQPATTETPSSSQESDSGEGESTQPPETVKPTAPPTVPPSTEGEDLQARIDALIEEVYALKDYYIAKLAYLENEAREKYNALPEDQRTSEKRRSMALNCVDEAYALENECDRRMNEICSELSYLLLKTDGRMNLVNDIRYAYAKEKEQAKSAFLEKYADYFG